MSNPLPRILIALGCLAFLLPAADAGTDTPAAIAGWRGNWTGRFPEARVPLVWGKTSKLLAGLRCSAEQPEGDAPRGSSARWGAVTEWLILGPLPAEKEETALGQQYPPDEPNYRPREGERVGPAVWAACRPDGNMVDLAARFGKEARGVAYAHSYLWSAVAGTVRFRFLSHNELKATVNGQVVWPGKEPTNVVLNKGWNRLLCKVAWGAQEGPYNIYPSLWHLGVGLTAVAPFASEAQSLQWQTRLPSWSIAGPLIVGDRVFVMSEPNDLICLNKADGRIRWVRSNNFYDALSDQEKQANPAFAEVELPAARLREINGSFAGGWPEAPLLAEKAKLERTINDLLRKADLDRFNRNWGELHGNCAGTPVSDGKDVYVWLSFGIAARYDRDGHRKWIRLVNNFIKHHGYTSSPVLVAGKLVVYMKKLIAFDAASGEIAWSFDAVKDDRLYGDHFHDTPVVIPVGSRKLLYIHGQLVRPSDGKVLWDDDKWQEQQAIPSAIVADGRLFQLGSAGELLKSRLPSYRGPVSLTDEGSRLRIFPGLDAYTRQFFAASPVYHEGLLYLLDCMGNLRVVDAATKQIVYEKDLGLGLEVASRVHIMGTAYASLVLAGKYLLAVGMTGTVVAFAPGRAYRELARNKIEHVTDPGVWYEKPEGFPSAPICEGTRLYLRGDEYLYCFGGKGAR